MSAPLQTSEKGPYAREVCPWAAKKGLWNKKLGLEMASVSSGWGIQQRSALSAFQASMQK